jgi:hypothetical protein
VEAPDHLTLLAAQRSAGNRAVVQRLFGLEKETRVPIKLKDTPIPEYPTIATAADFHVDVDRSGEESILEFVVHAFDEHRRSATEAHGELDRRLRLIEAFILDACGAAPKTKFEELAGRHNAKVVERYEQAELNTGKKVNPPSTGAVHFTVGVALESVPGYVRDRLANDKVSKSGRPRKRAMKAQSFGDDVAEMVADANKTKLVDHQVSRQVQGFMELVFMQVAALMDGVKRSGLKKNLTQALSRVPMGIIHKSLPEPDRAWLSEQRESLIDKMRTAYSSEEGKWGDHKKDEELIPAPARGVLAGAFGLVGGSSPDDDFGKMTVVLASEPVGPTGTMAGYALELRREEIDPAANMAEVAKHAHKLLDYSRLAHGGTTG